MDYYGLEYEFENTALRECLDELNQQDREIIWLYYWWGYGDAEIGEILGESQQTINYRRRRALKKIKDYLLKRA